MRKARLKPENMGVYYHFVNHSGGNKHQIPFDDEDKRRGEYILKKLAKYFRIEVISYCWMGNHFHLVVYAPDKPPTAKEAADLFNTHYGLSVNSSRYLTPEKNEKRCIEISYSLIDISQFMKSLQQTFSIYFNKKYDHHGPVWKSRFWSTILDGKTALWDCVSYVELNPVRAKICNRPEHYLYSSWGRFSQHQSHPFHDTFVKHMGLNGENSQTFSFSEFAIFREFKERLNGIIIRESRFSIARLLEKNLMENFNHKISMERCFKKVSSWTNSLVVGSQQFIDLIIEKPPSNGVKVFPSIKMSQGINSDGTKIFACSNINYLSET